MDTLDPLYASLGQMQNQDLFIYTDSLLDFSNKQPGRLMVENKSTNFKIPLNSSIIKLRECLGALSLYLGGDDSIVLTWNIKNFFSYALGRTGVDFKLNGKIYDLSILESYVGGHGSCPQNFSEAHSRLGKIVKNPRWSEIHRIYQQVHLPLIRQIPHIETYGLAHRQKKSKVYSHYTIDGQINGRMKCSNAYAASYNPHSLSVEEKDNLRNPGFDYNFMYFDYKHMEVSVLQWLTKDVAMGEILNSGEDFYAKMWEILTNSSCNKERRQLCKNFFLPIFYGMGAEAMAKKMEWSVDACRTLIERVHRKLPVAFNWMRNETLKIGPDGEVFDRFGRCRFFDVSYKVRNFVVQSPASLVCLHKLVQLIEGLGQLGAVCMHIHDGYVISVKKENLFKTYMLTKQILESEHELYPGLKLKTGCKVGTNLNELKEYPKED